MILSRVIHHVKNQQWTAVFLDFVIVVLGVVIGIQVSNWNQARADDRRTKAILAAISADLGDYARTSGDFVNRVSQGLAAFEAARARGEQPAPYFFRVRGSYNPPLSVWEVALRSDLSNLVSPDLVFDLGFFYSEQQGIGERFTRYEEFVEREILPRLGDPSAFYGSDGRLKPVFAQSMERLREWASDNAVLIGASSCLRKRFEAPRKPGASCRPDYGKATPWTPQT
ncbi:MAG TPA: hypothetical protein VKA19_13855 [Alphaproteobacteria bacterium]|nr:hypothetical protein [Alphaproteobacteria bacterium]